MGKALDAYKKQFDAIHRGDIKRFYFLYGPEEYLKKELIGELIKAVLPEQSRIFNLDIFHGDDFDRAAFDDRMSSFPLFVESRIVILRRFEDLSAAAKDTVLERVRNIPQDLVFIAESSHEKLDNTRVKSLKKAADEQGTAFQCSYLPELETLDRVRSRLKREGLEIDQDALELLVDSVGTRLSDLINEIEKVSLGAEKSRRITRADVQAVVGRYRTENLYALQDLVVSSREPAEFIRKLDRLIDGGEEPVFILALLLKRVIQLLRIKSLQAELGSRPLSSQELAGRLELSPFNSKELLLQAQTVNREDLEVLLENLRWADYTLKTSAISPKHLLEEAFFAASVRKKLATSANLF